MTDIPIKIQFVKLLSTAQPSRIVAVKADGDTAFSLFVTDKTGIPYPLKDLQNNVIITNTDGNLQITNSSTSTNINLAPSILVAINSALQSGDNISELVNDAGYLTTFTEVDPIFQASEASLFVSGDKSNLDNQSGVNSGDQTSIVGISGTKAQFNAELTDGDFLFVGDATVYTNEEAQDAVGSILTDSTTIDFTYDDTTPTISANVKLNSIDATHLADNINISEFVNDEGYITDVNLGYTASTTNGTVTNDKGTDATIPTVDFTNAGLLTPEEKQLLYNNSATGVTKFEGFSINADTTKYNTGLIEGWFIDNTTNPNVPTKVFKSFPATIGNTLTNIATQNVTYVAVDINGVHQQSGVPFEPEVQRDWTPLGVVVHSNRTTINAVNNQPVVALSPNNQLSDLMESIGMFNIYGNVFSPNGVNLSINKSAGQIFKQGSNFITNTKDPHTTLLSALVAPTNLRYRTQIGTEFANTNVIDAGFYDLAGVRTVIPGTRWSIQRIYIFQTNLVRIQYGQATYTSKTEAIEAISTEAFVTEQNTLENGLFRGLLIVREGATDLTDPLRALFITASKFGSVAGLGSLSTTTLQQAYNNSLTPEVTTDSILGAITLKRGSTADTDNVFEIENGAGTITSTIKGNGALTALTYNGYIPENITNKVIDFSIINNTLYPTIQAVKTYADNLVAGLLDDRGSYNASTNLFPTTGGSGTAGAVLKGDFWYVAVAGILGGQSVNIGDSFRALTDTPAQISNNWSILEGNLGYVPANSLVNISTTTPLLGGGNLTLDRTLSIQQATASQSGFLTSTDWNTFNSKQTALGYTPEDVANKQNSLAADGTNLKYPTVTAVNTGLALKANLASPTFTGVPIVPTATAGTNTGQAASTAFVTGAITTADSGNVKLTGSQTITGVKTINGYIQLDADTGFTSGGTKIIVQRAGDHFGFMSIGTSGQARFNTKLINPAVPKTYNLQDLDGTLALTSNPTSLTATSFINSTAPATNALLANGTTLANPISGSGTTGYLQKITSAGVLGNSIIFDNGTNVGIGTNLPTQGVLVVSPITPSGTVDGVVVVYNPDGASDRLRAKLWIDSFNGKLDLKSSADTQTVSINSNGASYFNGGNVLIGTATDNGVDKLQVNGTVTASNGQLIGGTGTTGYLQKVTSAGVIGNSIIFDNGSNVGIGTLTPAEYLSVKGNILIDANKSLKFGNVSDANSPAGISQINGFGLKISVYKAGSTGVLGADSLEAITIEQTTGQVSIAGKLKAFYPFYASDAAADADATLLSGQCYKITGSRAVYQKP